VHRALTPGERRTLLVLARGAILDRLRGDGSLERLRSALEITPALEETRGAFVTLHVTDAAGDRPRLRGCIGTVAPTEPLHRHVIENAIHAAFDDPRFPPLEEREVPGLTIEISALTPMRPVEGPEVIVPGSDGVYLERGTSRAVFLPQVATEQGWGTREMLEHLALKAHLPRDGWHGASLKVFKAEVFGERDPVADAI
jgi:AmmeMemoRadiSam system protein A